MTANKSAAAWHPGDGPVRPGPHDPNCQWNVRLVQHCTCEKSAGPVKPLDLDAIRARADAATPGPWQINRSENCIVREADGLPLIADIWVADVDIAHENTEFIVHAREDIPALLAALAAETARADQAEQRIADALASFKETMPPYNMELRPDGSEDPVASAYVDGYGVAYQPVHEILSATPTTGQ